MLVTHEQVGTRRGHVIYQRKPGFEFTPVLLGKIASFLIQLPDGSVAGAAFMYPLLTAALDDVREERLLAGALQRVEELIEQHEVQPYQDRTFELHSQGWVEVDQPRWWISTMPR
jgi:hypothetical protein